MATPSLVIRPSTKILAMQYIFANLFLLTAIFVRIRLESTFLTYTLVLFWAALALWTASTHLAFHFTTLTLRGDSLVLESGLLTRSTRSLNLAKVQDVRVDRKPMDRLFDLGDITLETAGESGSLVMIGIDRPRQVAAEILARARQSAV